MAVKKPAKKTKLKAKKMVAGKTSTGKVPASKKPMKAKKLSIKKGLAKGVKSKMHGLKGKPKSAAHKEAISKAMKAHHARKRGGKKIVKKAGKKTIKHTKKAVKKSVGIRGKKPTTKAGRAKRGAKVHARKVAKGLAKHTTKYVTNIKARKRTHHPVTGKPLGRKVKKG